MSIEAVAWALNVPVGGNEKVILLGLANHAHPDGTETYPTKETLARYAHCDPSTAVRNRKKLDEAGWIERDGVGPNGQSKYRLAMGPPFPRDGDLPPVAAAPEGDGAGVEGGVAPVPPEPSKEPSGNRPSRKRAQASAPDSFPDDLPPALHDVAIEAGRILKRAALERGQTKAVTRRTVGHAVLTYDDRDHVRVAREVEAWVLHGKGATRSCADIVARYRNFLANADPRPGPPLNGANVAPRGGPSTGPSKLRQMAAELRRNPPQ